MRTLVQPYWTAVVCAGVMSFGVACGKHEKPNTVYMPDMAYSPALKAQEEGSMRMPVKGTVPRHFSSYAYKSDPEGAGRDLKNPLKRTEAVFKRGQAQYNTYCVVCHGPAAEGDGSIIPKFPRPPSLHSDKVTGWSDGRIFHVITMGQNIMPSYASQISREDRWAIIHYVRALQRSKKPTPEDLRAYQAEQGE